MQRVLFVCTGNTCRSPMAEVILKNKNIAGIEVKSAGVYAVNGSDASANAKQVWKENAIQHEHRSNAVTEELMNWASIILTMTVSHKAALLHSYPEAAGKTFTLKEFIGEKVNADVIDPFGGDLGIYRSTYQELESLIDLAIDRIYKEKQSHQGD